MDERMVPQSLRIALNVTEAEYRKARAQSRIVWLATFAGAAAGLGLWAAGLRLTGWLIQAVGTGVGVHFLMLAILPEAKKTGSARLQKYRELQVYRASLEKLKPGGRADGGAGPA